MEIIFLGTASGMPVPHRNSASLYIGSPNSGFLLDAGDGSAKQLTACGISQDRIKAVFISHTHPDHSAGIFTLIQSFYLLGRKDPLNVYLPPGVLPGFADILPFFQIYREKWSFKINIHPLTDGIMTENHKFRIKGIKNDHLKNNRYFAEKYGLKADAYSFNIQEEDKNGIIYTSDIPSLNHLKHETDETQLLISECTHISVEEIRRFAREAKIPRVLLTHIPPEKEDIQLEQTSRLDLNFAYDGLRIEV